MNPAPRVKAFDVWFVAANTVYKQVPYGVVADWTGQGRLAASDMIRPAGSTEPWQRVDKNRLLADYLPRAAPPVVAVAAAGASPEAEAQAAEAHGGGDEHWPHPKAEEDDEVDMIPLIDISMVLLVFFIMMQSSKALDPVDIPDMVYAGKLNANATAITIVIDKASETDIKYSVRVGETETPENSNLKGPDARKKVLEKMREQFPDVPQPREVRITCHRELPSERVFELMEDLRPFKESGAIAVVNAEVHEKTQ